MDPISTHPGKSSLRRWYRADGPSALRERLSERDPGPRPKPAQCSQVTALSLLIRTREQQAVEVMRRRGLVRPFDGSRVRSRAPFDAVRPDTARQVVTPLQDIGPADHGDEGQHNLVAGPNRVKPESAERGL